MFSSHRFHSRRSVAPVLLVLLLAAPAAAQYVTFPRLGLSAAPDRYEPTIDVHGSETFELHVIVLPHPGEVTLQHEFSTFHWAVLEACCGGAAAILDEAHNPACQSEGFILGGVVTEFASCVGGEVVHLATLTMQMMTDVPGEYAIIAGPLTEALTCDQQGVVMVELPAFVRYTTDVMPIDVARWSQVKRLFR